MDRHLARLTRRTCLGAFALGALGCMERGAFAEELTRTPAVTEGPFYPDRLPLDTDNDLLIVNDAITPAVGEITHLGGRLLDAHGEPLRNAVVEIWQCDHTGTYLKERTQGQRTGFDANFQGFGRFVTGTSGAYAFRTIKPVPYPQRPAPHIHVAVTLPGRPRWTTQVFIAGDPGNLRDGIYRDIGDERARAAVSVDFTPIAGSRIGELAAHFDIVLGVTPQA